MEILLKTEKTAASPSNGLEPLALLHLAAVDGGRMVTLLSSGKPYKH